MPRSRPPSISPPPLKRRRLSPTQASISPQHPSLSAGIATSTPHSLSAPASGSLRILSWNVNGIDAFLPARARDQKAITTFFTPTKTSSHPPRSKKREACRPSLRGCLRRWGWPHVVCLQEVKIARSDTRTQDAVRRMVSGTGKDWKDDFSDGGEASDAVRRMVSHSSQDQRDDSSDSEEASDAGSKDGEADRGIIFGYDAHFSLPRDTYNARGPRGIGKVYGVCTLLRRDVSSVQTTLSQDRQVQTKVVSWDLEGRVLVTSIPSPSSSTSPSLSPKDLIIFNIYAVNGTTNPYHDPTTGAITGDRHGHKRRFHTHLARAVRAYKEEGWEVVIAGDLNIARGPNDSYPSLRLDEDHVRNRIDFEEKFMKDGDSGLGMVDTFRHVHGEEREYTYRPTNKPWGSGMDRVDLILCSDRMIERTAYEEGREIENGEGISANVGRGDKSAEQGWRLVYADILDSPEDRGPSDHVPLYIDIWNEAMI